MTEIRAITTVGCPSKGLLAPRQYWNGLAANDHRWESHTRFAQERSRSELPTTVRRIDIIVTAIDSRKDGRKVVFTANGRRDTCAARWSCKVRDAGPRRGGIRHQTSGRGRARTAPAAP